MPIFAQAVPPAPGALSPSGFLGDPALAGLKEGAAPIELKRGTAIYREGDPADALYEVVAGGVKNLIRTPGAAPIVVGFRFAGDVFGFARAGRHLDTAETISAVLAYKIPLAGIAALPDEAAALRQVNGWICADLHDRQQQIARLSRKDALGRLALFVAMMERRFGGGRKGDAVRLPMRRTDIASYLNLTPEALSRGFRALLERGIVRFHTKRQFAVIDRAGLRALTADKGRRAPHPGSHEISTPFGAAFPPPCPNDLHG